VVDSCETSAPSIPDIQEKSMPTKEPRTNLPPSLTLNGLISQLRIDQDQLRKHRALLIAIESLLPQEAISVNALAEQVGLQDEILIDFLECCYLASNGQPLFCVSEVRLEQIPVMMTFSDAVRNLINQ
jgi:hypothetical protein